MTPGRVRFALAVALVLLLEALCRFGVINRFSMIPPSEILWHLGRLLASAQMWPAILKTLTNVVVACVAAIVVGVILGTLIHRWRALRETLDPLFAAYYAIPVYAFYPLFIVIFGLGDLPQVLIGFMLGLVAVVVNTLNGLDRVPRVLIKTARIHRLGPGRDRAEGHAALCGAVHLHRHQARGGVFVHRRDRRRADHVAHRPRLRDRLCLQQFRQCRDVSADRVRARGRGDRQHDVLPVGEEDAGEAAQMTRLLRAAILVACLLAGWQLLFWFAGSGALTSPAETIAFTLQLVASPSFYPHLAETAKAFAVALGIAISCGILIGFSLGLYRFASEVAEPVLVALYSIPKITLYPIVLLAFGIGMPAKIAFGAIHGIVPIAIFALGAVRNLNPVYLKAARVMRLTPWRIASPRAAAGRDPGDLHRHPHRLLAHADRHAARRDVRLAARPRSPADAGDRPAQHPHDHGGHLAAGGHRRDGQRAAARGRPEAARHMFGAD